MVNKSILIGVLLVILTLPPSLANAQTAPLEAAEQSLYNAYQETLNAHNAGVNTTQLVEQLNQALNLTTQAQKINSTNPQQAEALITQVQALAENVTQQAQAAEQSAPLNWFAVTLLVVSVLLVTGVLVFVFGPRLMWRIWFRFRKNYRVKLGVSKETDKSLIITAQQVCAAILAIIIIISFLSVYQVFFPQRNREPFSEFGVLGSNMKLGDYPSQIVASETVNLYGYVGNQMGKPMFYTVMVKLGDNTTVINPVKAAAIQQYSQVLSFNQTWIFPVSVTLTHIGNNQRLIFELWYYNETQGQMQYPGEWGQVWVNVTAPAV